MYYCYTLKKVGKRIPEKGEETVHEKERKGRKWGKG
jgi:hypothetical protein